MHLGDKVKYAEIEKKWLNNFKLSFDDTMDLFEIIHRLQSDIPIVTKKKNDRATVIEWRGQRYVLDMTTK
jgi:hypothetical protein